MSNVLQFGAKGDGTTDDTDAILHTLKDGDGVLEFPRGDYLITRTIEIPLAQASRTAITGFGGVAKVIMAGEGPAFHLVGTHGGTAHPPSFKPDVWTAQRLPTVQNIEVQGKGDGSADGFRIEGLMQPTFEEIGRASCRERV